MSASNKKKLRREQEAAKITERQLSARKEAKKTRIYTIAFVTVMVAMLVVAITVGISQTISSSGIREKNTVAMTVGDHEISNAEMNYFYVGAVNEFYNTYGDFIAYTGLDFSTPLDEQVLDPETGRTWADDFMDSAKSSATATYAVADAANAAGFTLSEEELASLDANIQNMEFYTTMSGFPSFEDYLQAVYGKGATVESYREYCELVTLAVAYQNHYANSLTYTDADLRAQDSENFNAYSSYTFNTYYLSAARFQTGGTVNENGTTVYTDEEKAAGLAAAEEAAKTLTSDEITSLEALDAAIAGLSINEGNTASSTANSNVLYTSVSSIYADWVTDESRQAGDVTYIPNTSTSTGEDGAETTSTDGYYVVYFVGSTDNTFALKNVRHILVPFQGGATDPTTGMTTYTDEEKAASMTTATSILTDWNAGEATEDSFAALAMEKSTDTGSAANGGLYEDIYPGMMVEPFEDWCFEESRKPGDTGIVESTYGYHIMYFSGDSEQNYRDFMITNELRTAATNDWYNGLVEAMAVTDGNTRYIVTGKAVNEIVGTAG